MSELQQNLALAIERCQLKLNPILGTKKEALLKLLMERFVEGNPRALWLSFKYRPTHIHYQTTIESELLNFVPAQDEVYFIVDDWNNDFHLYLGKITDIVTLIGEGEGIDEYYILYNDFTKLACETDHGDLLYIDLNSVMTNQDA